MKKYNLIINGNKTENVSGNYIEDINPATGEIIAEIPSGTVEDVDRAVSDCNTAFKIWRKKSIGYRAGILNKLANIIEEKKRYFAEVESRDTGKCINESLLQMDLSIEQYRYFAGCLFASEDRLVPHNDGSFSMIVREPLGVVAIVLPWNAPSMLMSWKLAPALAAGNCVVIKPASNAAAPVLELAEAFQAVLPPGVVNVVTGPGGRIGDHIANHPGIAKVSFTGSTVVGIGVGEKVARRLGQSTLELGGKSANIIFPDASIDRAVEYATIGILSTAGEVCVAGSRLLLHEDIYDLFLEKIKVKFQFCRVGDPMSPESQMGPVIDQKQLDSVLEYIEIGKKEGADLLCGGKRLTGSGYDNGFYVEPTIFHNVDNSMRIAKEEIFGPVLCVLKFKDEQDAVKIANDSEYGLGAAVWTKDINLAMRVSRSLEAGTVWINDYLNSAYGGSFGGYKKSGIGREVHKVAFEYYSQIKNICISTSEDIPQAF